MPDYDSAGTTRAGRPVRWESYTASAMGADHRRAGKPNEDAVAASHLDLPGGAGAQVIAVADGHGHVRHFRSERGSKLAVTAAVAAAQAWAAARPGTAAVTSASIGDLVSDVVRRWRDQVAADLRADPVSAERLASLPAGDPPEIPYGATLLMAVLGSDTAVLAQIGDGEMLLILPDGRHLEPVPADSRLDGTRTTSLCQPDAVSAFRVGLVNLARTPAYAVFASTDGYGNAQADASWQRVFAADLVRLGMEHGSRWIGGQLEEWAAVCASSDGSGDDTTVALALNSAAPLTAPPRPKRPPAGSTTQHKTLPYRPVPDAEKTLIWPDQPALSQAAPTLPAPVQPVPARPPHADHTIGTTAIPAGPQAAPAILGGRLPISRLWLVGAIVVVAVIAVSVFLLTSGSGRGGRPAFTPTPAGTATPKPRHSTGQSVGGGTKAGPTSSPTGGSADFARSAGAARAAGDGRGND